MILDVQPIADGGTYTPAAGSNRILVVVGFGEVNYGYNVSGMSFGGVALTSAAKTNISGQACKGGLFFLKEADIPAGESTLTVTWSGGSPLGPLAGVAYTLGDRAQDAPLDFAAIEHYSGVSSANLPVTTSTDGILIALAGSHATARDFDESSTTANSTLPHTITTAGTNTNFDLLALYDDVAEGADGDLHFAVSGGTSGITMVAAVFAPVVTTKPGIPSNTLEYQGTPVTAATATFSIHAGTDLKTTADYRIAGVALTNGAFGSIDLSGTSIAVGDPIVVEALPSSGPGIILRTTAGDIA